MIRGLVIPVAVLLWTCSARPDSAVVFNELMYHPLVTDGFASEWVELSNQMGVDMDVSNWQLDQAVHYTFPEGTVIPGGGYLVIAASPPALSQAGLTNVLGPFTGRLGNGGNTLQLRNNNRRLMDELAYGTEDDWPVAPDGAGPSLARRVRNLATADPANWRASSQIGGTPGRENFPTVQPALLTNTLISLSGLWKFNDLNLDLGAAWREADFDDSAWPSGTALFYRGDAPLPGLGNTPLAPGPVTHYFRTRFLFVGDVPGASLLLRSLAGDGAVFYLNGVEVLRLNMPSGPISFGTLASSPVAGATFGPCLSLPAGSIRSGTNVLAVEVHRGPPLAAYPRAVLTSGPIGYWRLGETNGTAADSAAAPAPPQSGAQNGTCHGFLTENLAQKGPVATDLVNGRVLKGFEAENNALRFAGDNDGGDDLVLIPDRGVFSFAAAARFTIEAWVNGPASQESGAPVLCKGTGAGGEQYCLDVYEGRYRLYVWDSGGTPAVAGASVGPNNTWQHVVGLYDQAAGQMKVYVNGLESASGTPRPSLVSTSHELSLGARQTSSGAYDLNFEGRIDEAAIYNRALPAAEILAHFNAAFDTNVVSGPDANVAVFALELFSRELAPQTVPWSLTFNELPSATNDAFWIEVINHGAAGVDLGGCVVARLAGGTNQEHVISPQGLAPGGLAQIPLSEVGFTTEPGDRLVLYGPGRSNVLDAVVAKREPRGRYPDGSGRWLFPSQPTPGASNRFRFHDEVVINEIMFHPREQPGLQPTAPLNSWVELFNRSTNPVSLAGWRLAGDIDYRFASNQVIGPERYLVVAKDAAAMQSVYPGIAIVGPFSNQLSKSGGYVALKDSAGNPANEVRYFTGGRWPRSSDGGGSSIELRDPGADNSAAEAWAASDESGKSSWATYTWRGVSAPGQPSEPTLWHEFALCLLDGAGEVLLDDISVVERPATRPKQLIPNGSFDRGIGAHWRFLGTHRQSRVEPEPGNPGNYVLHLIVTGPGEYQGNQVETTLTNNLVVTDGIEYEVSFRAKWLAGKSLLNSRLYFNRLARTVQLAVPALNGTPGAINSRFVPNLGPTFANLRHWPIVPEPLEPFTVRIEARDPDGVAAITLFHSENGGAWQSNGMTPSAPGLPQFEAVIPGQPAASVVQFYVEATDTRGASSTFPAGGIQSRALCSVRDGQLASGPLRDFRVLMTTPDATFLHTGTNTLSNELLGCTVVSEEREVFYDVGVRLKGSFVGRNVNRVGFHIQFQPDNLFRGVHDKVVVDRSQHATTGGVGEILVKHLAGHAGGIPSMYDDLARFLAPLASYNSMSSLRLAGFDDLYLDSQFQHGGRGTMYEPEVLRWELSTVDGNPESPKRVGTESGGTGYQPFDLQDYGDNKESYRWSFPLMNERTVDDFSGVIGACRLFSLTGTAFAAQAPRVLDVDEWCRVLAFQSLIGPADAYYTGGGDHNYRLYQRPEDGRILYFPWDWDSCFMLSPTAPIYGGGNVTKLFETPAWKRAYLNHLYDLILTSFNTGYAARWAAHYGGLSGQDFSGVLGYIGARASYVMNQLPTTTPFTITTSAGRDFSVTNGLALLAGAAPISVSQIQVNGIVYPITWTSATQWNLSIPLNPGPTSLTLRGLNQQGSAVTNATASIVVTNSDSSALQAVVINEWMADNQGPGGFPDPASGSFEDWFELFNPNATAVNLSGLYLTDNLDLPAKWQIPADVFISGRGFLMVWADGHTNENPTAGGTNVDLHAAFSLNKEGESIGLFAADGVTPLSVVTFGPQVRNVSQGRSPDGDSATLYSMPGWTPGAPNTLASVTAPHILSVTVSERTVTLVCEVMPARTCELQFKAVLAGAAWSTVSLATAPRIAGGTLIFNDFLEQDVSNRFYRVVLLP